MKRVIIIGGGYAGTQLARALDPSADVTLIEPREAFVHNVGAIRAIVEPSLLDSLILPYTHLLKRGCVVRDRAIAIQDNAVKLASGQTIMGEVIVIATGSSYHAPFKPVTDTMADFRSASHSLYQKVDAASTIAIIGAGAVGVELAGEIASARPEKQITLISAADRLFPEFNPLLGQRLEAKLKALGIHVHLSTRAEGGAFDQPSSGTLSLSSAMRLTADLIIPALGARPVTHLCASLGNTRLDQLGRIETDPWLRVAGCQNLFVLGDAASCGDRMTIVAILRQAAWLAKTLQAFLAGQSMDRLPIYTPWQNPPFLVPLGAKQGGSILPIGKNGLVLGDTLTSIIKGKKLFIPRYHKEFGVS